MQLVLELLKKIFIALQGVYTKSETDAALAVKADKAELVEEAQSREQADAEVEARVGVRLAEHDAEIETLQKVTAGLGEGATAAVNVAKWQTYATAIQKDLDAETAMQLAQEFSRATDEYLADPKARKNWITNSSTESTSPYFSVAPTRPVVDFSVNSATGGYGKGAFDSSTNVPIFLPNATICNSILNVATSFNQPLFLPSATGCQYLLNYATSFNQPLFLPSATNCSYMLQNAKAFNQPLSLPNAANCLRMLNGAKVFNQPLFLPKCSGAQYAFANTEMSAENISATLDSLPAWTDGASHVITFTGSAGASELTQESPSVAAAVARGWTVEL
jgi:hypothetical protein